MYYVVPYDELYHYGVKGQRWGIRRTPEQLGHRIKKLEKKNRKLNEKSIKKTTKGAKYEAKASKLRYKGMKKESKATSERQYRKARKYQFKAAKLDMKGNKFKLKAAKAQAKMYKNDRLISQLENTITAIDKGTIRRGQNFMTQYLMLYEAPSEERVRGRR